MGQQIMGGSIAMGDFLEEKLKETMNAGTLVSGNITVLGRRTSVRLEKKMWDALKDVARREKCTIHDICSLVSVRKQEGMSLTSAIRLFLMLYYRAASTEEGHIKAAHGDFANMKSRASNDRKMAKIIAPSIFTAEETSYAPH